MPSFLPQPERWVTTPTVDYAGSLPQELLCPLARGDPDGTSARNEKGPECPDVARGPEK